MATPGTAPLTDIVWNLGPKRPNKPSSTELLNILQRGVAETYGPGAKIIAISGMENAGRQHGSNRHRTGKALDFGVQLPDGQMVTGPAMDGLATWAAKSGILGIGYGGSYMGGRHFHMDMVSPGKGQAHTWGGRGKARRKVLTDLMLGRGGGREVADGTRDFSHSNNPQVFWANFIKEGDATSGGTSKPADTARLLADPNIETGRAAPLTATDPESLRSNVHMAGFDPQRLEQMRGGTTAPAAPAAPAGARFDPQRLEQLRRGNTPPAEPPAPDAPPPNAVLAMDALEKTPALPPEPGAVSPTDLITATPIGALLQGIKQALPDEYSHLVDEAVRGAGFGWTDQAVGAVGAAIEGRNPFGERSAEIAAADRAASDAARKQEMERGESVNVLGYDITPGDVVNFGGSVAGSAPVAGALVAKAGAAAAPAWTGLAKTGAGAIEGMAFGVTMAAGQADNGDRLKSGAIGMAGGALLGAVLTRAGVSYERWLAKKASKQAAKTVAETKAIAGQMYDEAERLGARYDPFAATTLSDDLERVITDKVLADDELAFKAIRKVQGIIDNAKKTGRPIDMTTIKRMKQVIRRRMENTKPGSEDARILMGVRNKVEDFAIDDANMIAFGVNGSGKGAAQIRKEADLLWRNAKTAEELQTAMEKAAFQTMATGSGGNINNKIKQVFARIAGDPKQMRRYTPDEQAAIKAVVDQGMSSNALRLIGKLSMGGNGLMQALQLYAAVQTGGVSALTIPVAAAAKHAADAKTTRLAQEVITVILSGGKVPPAAMRLMSGAERRAVSSAVAKALTANNAEVVGSAITPSRAPVAQ